MDGLPVKACAIDAGWMLWGRHGQAQGVESHNHDVMQETLEFWPPWFLVGACGWVWHAANTVTLWGAQL